MTLQLRCEQWHRNGARLDGGEEPGDVIQTLRSENRDPVSAGRDPLHLRADGPNPDAELVPGQFVGEPTL